MKTISGIEAHCAFDKEVDVEDEQLYAGVNGGRQVKAGEVLAVPPKCAVRLFEFGRVPRHNLPLAFSGRHLFPHPDIREAAFPAKRLAVFVLAYGMVITIRDREVLAINAHVEGGIGLAGVRVGRVLEESKSGFLIENSTVWHDVGKVVRPNTFQVRHIFCDADLTPLFRELRKLLRDLFGFANRYRRLRQASGNTSRQSCADSYEYNR